MRKIPNLRLSSFFEMSSVAKRMHKQCPKVVRGEFRTPPPHSEMFCSPLPTRRIYARVQRDSTERIMQHFCCY